MQIAQYSLDKTVEHRSAKSAKVVCLYFQAYQRSVPCIVAGGAHSSQQPASSGHYLESSTDILHTKPYRPHGLDIRKSRK